MLSLGVSELAARLLVDPPRTHRGPAWFDPDLGFRGIPGYELAAPGARLNSQGFRGAEVAERTDDALRVGFVGDSFLVAAALAEQELMTEQTRVGLEAAGRSAHVFNLSVIDYGTAQQLMLLREQAAVLDPDAVVLALYPANDVINNARILAGMSRVSAGDPVRPYLEPTAEGFEVRYTHPLRAGLRRTSRLAAHAENIAVARGWLPTFPQPPTTAALLRSGHAPQMHLEIFRRAEAGTAWREAWSATFDLLREFRDECRSQSARLLVLVIPQVEQVLRTAKSIRADQEARSAGFDSLDELLDWSLPEKELARFFDDENIDARFLLGPLREAVVRGETVYERDEHLAAAGHAIASELVVDWLRSKDAPSVPLSLGSGAPVRLLPPPRPGAPLLSFRHTANNHHLGDGWLSWRSAADSEVWGWRIGPQALIALPANGQDLLIRGVLPETSRVPARGFVLRAGGGELRPFQISKRGPFELRIAIGDGPGRGQEAVILAPGVTGEFEGWPIGFVVQEIGFAVRDD